MEIEELIRKIVDEQSQIIGDGLAKSIAVSSGVVDFDFFAKEKKPALVNDKQKALGKLISTYKELFGQASVEVCNNVLKKYGVETSPK